MSLSKGDQAEQEVSRAGPLVRIKVYLKSLGPGLVTGASDDDPSGIGTYAQTGALLGYTQLWIALFTFPLMTVIQEVCARIALQTGAGLAESIRDHFPRPVLYFCVTLLVITNTLNLGADLGAMAESGQLLVHLPFVVWLVAMAALCAGLEVWMDYSRYSRVLRLLSLTLLAYVLVAFVVPLDWHQALRATIIPTFRWDHGYLMNLVAVLGTTISPYLFFWQAAHEVEEEIKGGKKTRQERRGASRADIRWMRADVVSGMLFSNIITWFIIAATAFTLYKHGIHNIDSAARASLALKPIAGRFAAAVFAAGILGTGLLAVPVLAGSSAYAVAATLRVRRGLYLKFHQAPGFYAVIILSTAVGAAMSLLGINPMRALYYTAVLNGLVAPPLMVMVMLIGGNREIMGEHANGRLSAVLGWLVTAIMAAAAVAMVVDLLRGHSQPT